MSGIATAIVGAAVVGGVASSVASNSAANKQQAAANNATQEQWNQFQTTQQNLAPYMQLGSSSIPQLQSLLNGPGLNSQFTFNPTEAQLQQTPGYQFTLNQGLNTVNNQLAAKGLNLSGAQAKGIAGYTTGLADQTYQQQYQNALSNFQTNYGVQANQYNRLVGLVGSGQNAAAGLGSLGAQTAATAGGFLTSGANASAAGTVGVGNAISGAAGSLGSSGLLYGLTQQGNNSSIYGQNPAYNGTSAQGFDNPANYG